MENHSTNGFGNNIYGNNITDRVNRCEKQGMQQNWESASNGPSSGVIPNIGFQQKILNQNTGGMDGANALYAAGSAFKSGGGNLGQPSKNGTFVSQLSGQTMAQENFTHNNMVPFFGGSVKQNMDMNSYTSTLARHTGTDDLYRKKTEVKSFYDVSKFGGSNINGAQASTTNDRITSHHIASRTRNNELPTEQIYTHHIPNGDFDKITRREGMVKTIDELRSTNNQKASGLPTMLKPGALTGGTRGKIGKINKNRPERFYRKTADTYFKNGGSIKGAKMREKVYAKPTNRIVSRSYYGVAGNSENTKTYKTSAIQKARKNNYMNPSPRNAASGDSWIINDDANNNGVGDYGLNGIENKPNERDVTQSRVHITNIVAAEMKKLIAPIQDVIKMTRKENFVGNARPDGNMSAAMPPKLKVHDSADVARTTIKETNIHNNHEGFISGGEFKSKAYDPEDIARTTIKETNIHNETPFMNMTPQQPTSLRVHDPEDVARVTLKEQTIDKKYIGGASAGTEYQKGGYLSNRVNMRNTNKQFNSDYEYFGGANGDATTGSGNGYLVTRVHAKNTNKQFTSVNEYKGVAGFHNSRPMSYADKRSMRLNPNKQHISQGRAPTQQGAKVVTGGDKVNMQFKKLEADQINIREPAESQVYQTPPTKNTCGLTTVKDKLPENIQRSRIDPDILDSYNNNPYTQSLTSVA
jgi:hypothetical protein